MLDKKIKNIEFNKIVKEIEQMRKRYMIALSCHVTFKRFTQLIAPNIIGKRKAEKNAEILSSYNYFFLTTKEAMRCYFLIELAKFFDKTKRNKIRTIYWMLKYAKDNIHGLGENNFLKHHGEDMGIFYKPLKIKDIEKLQDRLKKNENKIKRLNDYRDQYLAHDDMKKIKVMLTIQEMEVLLRIARDVLELFYNKLKSTSNSYKNFTQEPIINLDKLFKDLNFKKD